MRSTIFSVAVCAGILFFAAPTGAQDPLGPTFWMETLSLDLADQSKQISGASALSPEEISDFLEGDGCLISGSVVFASSGPPAGMTALPADDLQGACDALYGRAAVHIEFEFRVNQTAAPPVSVSRVPVMVHSRGIAGVNGRGLYAEATVSFQIGFHPFPSVQHMAEADTLNRMASFNESDRLNLVPGQVESVRMIGESEVAATSSPGASASPSASIDHDIEIADELIPGTSNLYSEFFELEFSSGYWALGPPAPVAPNRWGQIKKLYDW